MTCNNLPEDGTIGELADTSVGPSKLAEHYISEDRSVDLEERSDNAPAKKQSDDASMREDSEERSDNVPAGKKLKNKFVSFTFHHIGFG